MESGRPASCGTSQSATEWFRSAAATRTGGEDAVSHLELSADESALLVANRGPDTLARMIAVGRDREALAQLEEAFALHGKVGALVAIAGWDAIYYWNHRLAHETRWLWAVHVVHHSSERYNLSTALRQPVAEGFTMAVPYGLLALLGVPPRAIEDARAINLIYQFWIHTEAIRS